jgi:DNA-binding transcriptional MerR regulator
MHPRASPAPSDDLFRRVEYFSCPQDCGIFVLASKLSPPTSGPSRPSSVASSVRSHTSMGLHAPSGRETPGFERPAARPASVTPGKIRTVSSAIRGAGGFKLKEAPGLSEDRPTKTLLGNSTSSNAAIAASKITAGSRASKYVGMTAKQLEATRTGGLNASVRGLNASTMTPKASRVSMGLATPARSGRPSLGGSLATPRARPRQSTANEIMPPPPSPGKITLAMKAHQAQLEEEIRELKARNAELEVELQGFNSANPADDVGALNAQLERTKEEAATLRQELSNAQIDSTTATDRVNEMHGNELRLKEELGEKIRELAQLQKEMKLAVERAASELEAGMEAKRAEVQEMLERAERAEREIDEQNALVEQLTDAGHVSLPFEIDYHLRASGSH